MTQKKCTYVLKFSEINMLSSWSWSWLDGNLVWKMENVGNQFLQMTNCTYTSSYLRSLSIYPFGSICMTYVPIPFICCVFLRSRLEGQRLVPNTGFLCTYFSTIPTIYVHNGYEMATLWPHIRDRRKILNSPKISKRCQILSFLTSILLLLLFATSQRLTKGPKMYQIIVSAHKCASQHNQAIRGKISMVILPRIPSTNSP